MQILGDVKGEMIKASYKRPQSIKWKEEKTFPYNRNQFDGQRIICHNFMVHQSTGQWQNELTDFLLSKGLRIQHY